MKRTEQPTLTATIAAEKGIVTREHGSDFVNDRAVCRHNPWAELNHNESIGRVNILTLRRATALMPVSSAYISIPICPHSPCNVHSPIGTKLLSLRIQ
jgi:hypothetical protein